MFQDARPVCLTESAQIAESEQSYLGEPWRTLIIREHTVPNTNSRVTKINGHGHTAESVELLQK